MRIQHSPGMSVLGVDPSAAPEKVKHTPLPCFCQARLLPRGLARVPHLEHAGAADGDVGDVRGRRARLHQPQLLLLLRDHVPEKQHPLQKENKWTIHGDPHPAGQQGFGRLLTHKTAAGCPDPSYFQWCHFHPVCAAAHTDQFCLNTEIKTFEGNALGRGEDTDQSSLSDRIKTFRGNLLGKVRMKQLTFIRLAFRKKLHVTKCSRHVSLPPQWPPRPLIPSLHPLPPSYSRSCEE